MKTPDIETLRDIADELSMGLICFYHKQTGALESFPDPITNPANDVELFKEEIQKVEKNLKDYLRIEGMDSRSSFIVMEDFVREVIPQTSQQTFLDALAKRKPFQHFNEAISYQAELRTKWFEYKRDKYTEYVADHFKWNEE